MFICYWHEQPFRKWVKCLMQIVLNSIRVSIKMFFQFEVSHRLMVWLTSPCVLAVWGLMYVNPADLTELPPMSPIGPETSHLYLSLTWPPLNNDTPLIHTWLFPPLPAKPFDLSLTNPFTPHLTFSRHQYFINVQWQIYLNAVSGTDAEMDGPIGVVVGWWAALVASSFTAYISHTLADCWWKRGGLGEIVYGGLERGEGGIVCELHACLSECVSERERDREWRGLLWELKE